MSFTMGSYGGTNTTGFVIDLRGSGTFLGPGALQYNKCGSVTIDVNGSTGDFWVQVLGILDGVTAPAVPTVDPRVLAGGDFKNWFQVKSGEKITFGAPSSKGYDPAIHGGQPASEGQNGFFTHVMVWCQAAGTVTATQLRFSAA